MQHEDALTEKKPKLDLESIDINNFTKEEYESFKNELGELYETAIDSLKKEKVFSEFIHHYMSEIVKKIDCRTIEATINDVEHLKIKANNSYMNVKLAKFDEKEIDMEILMKNLIKHLNQSKLKE